MADQYKAEVEQWGYIDPARWNAFYNWLSDNGLVEQPIPENTGFSNDYLAMSGKGICGAPRRAYYRNGMTDG